MAHIYLFICYQIILSPGQSIVDGLHWCCIQEILSALLFQIHRGLRAQLIIFYSIVVLWAETYFVDQSQRQLQVCQFWLNWYNCSYWFWIFNQIQHIGNSIFGCQVEVARHQLQQSHQRHIQSQQGFVRLFSSCQSFIFCKLIASQYDHSNCKYDYNRDCHYHYFW
jgi:hypothetical protein